MEQVTWEDLEQTLIKHYENQCTLQGQEYETFSMADINYWQTNGTCEDLLDSLYIDEELYENDYEEYDQELNDDYDEDLYEDSYEEETYFGDGVDEDTLENIKRGIFHLVNATKRLGRICRDGENYLTVVLGLCNEKQRQEIMQCQKDQHQPLSLACEIGNLNVVKFLVEHCGADVNGMNGWPMLMAIFKGHTDIVCFLLEHFAHPSMFVRDHLNLFAIALGDWSIHNVDGRKKYYEKVVNKYRLSSYYMGPQDEIVKLMIDYDAVRLCSNSVLYDCLAYCFKYEKNDYLEWILDKISNINNLQIESGSILELAFKQSGEKHSRFPFRDKDSKLKGIRLLIEKGADINKTKLYPWIQMAEPSGNHTQSLQTNADYILQLTITAEQTCKKSFLDEGDIKYVHPIIDVASRGNSKILRYLLRLPQISFQYKLDALEVFGAHCASNSLFEDATLCWITASKIRLQQNVSFGFQRVENVHKQEGTDLEGQSHGNDENEQIDYNHDNPMLPSRAVDVNFFLYFVCNYYMENKERCANMMKAICPPRNVFKFQTEFDTIQVISYINPENIDPIVMLTQSALVFERLLGYGSQVTMNAFVDLASKYRMAGDLRQSVILLTYSLPYFIKHSKNAISRKFLKKIVCNDLALPASKQNLDFDALMAILKCVLVLMTHCSELCHGVFLTLLMVIQLLISCNKSIDDCREFARNIQKIVQLDLRDTEGKTLLHYAARLVPYKHLDNYDYWLETNYIHPTVLYKEIIEAIVDPLMLANVVLEFWSDANCVDSKGSTPLHSAYNQQLLLQIIFTGKDLVPINKISHMLLSAGSHPDCVDAKGRTPIVLSQVANMPLCPVKHRTLQCLASVVILQNNVPYREHVAPYLVEFVELHMKRGKLSEKWKYV